MIEKHRYLCGLGLTCIEDLMAASNFKLGQCCQLKLYDGLELLRERSSQEPNVATLNQKIRQVTDWDTDMTEIMARLHVSLEESNSDEDDPDWLVDAVDDYTEELAIQVKTIKQLTEIFCKMSEDILASKTAVKIYDSYMHGQIEQLLEQDKFDEIMIIPARTIDMFKENKLNNIRSRSIGEHIVLDESFVVVELDVFEEE